MKKWIVIAVVLSLSLPLWVFSAPLAMVMDVQGEVIANNKAVELLVELPENTEVNLSENASISLVYLASGSEYVVSGPKKILLKKDYLEIDGKKQEGEKLLVSAEDLADNNYLQASVQMRDAEDESKLVLFSPVSTGVLTTHPTLSWKSIGDDAQYHVEIISSESGDSVFSFDTDKTSVIIPENVDLPRDQTLTWEIEAVVGEDDPIYKTSTFSIIGVELLAQIKDLQSKSESSFSSKVLLAWLLDNKGFNEDAKKYWKMLAKERPHDKAIQAKLK